MMTHRFHFSMLALVLITVGGGRAQDNKDTKKTPVPAITPTAANVSYGKHERNVLDFWQAKSEKPTPLVFCIHGGGWQNGDKSSYYGGVKTFLDNGISVVTINYRLMAQANEEKVIPPVKLSITHNWIVQFEAQAEIGQSGESAPDDHVARRRVVRSGQVAAQLRDCHEVVGHRSVSRVAVTRPRSDPGPRSRPA